MTSKLTNRPLREMTPRFILPLLVTVVNFTTVIVANHVNWKMFNH